MISRRCRCSLQVSCHLNVRIALADLHGCRCAHRVVPSAAVVRLYGIRDGSPGETVTLGAALVADAFDRGSPPPKQLASSRLRIQDRSSEEKRPHYDQSPRMTAGP